MRRLGATAGLVVVLAAIAVVVGGAVALVAILVVDDTPAAEQAAEEAADAELLHCGQNLSRMTARVEVTNPTSTISDYFVDVEFVRRSGEVIEVATAVIERVRPADAARQFVETAASPPNRFDCRIGDVDRLAA